MDHGVNNTYTLALTNCDIPAFRTVQADKQTLEVKSIWPAYKSTRVIFLIRLKSLTQLSINA